MYRFLLTILALVFLGSCSAPYYCDFFPYDDDGVRKPHVALLPIQNGTSQFLPWNLPLVLNQCALYETMNHGVLYVYPLDKVEAILDTYRDVNFFTPDLAFSRLFPGSDFIVVAEMIEHTVKPYPIGYPILLGYPPQHVHALLAMKLRVRILDVREEEPRIVLQEVISESYAVPESPDAVRDQTSGECGFVACCYKLAYQKLMRKFVCRVEQVILSE